MSHAELVEWAAMYAVEPFGPIREDLRAGRIAATIANTVPRERGSKPFYADDFFPELSAGEAPPKSDAIQSRDEQLRNIRIWAIVSGAEMPGAAEQISYEQGVTTGG